MMVHDGTEREPVAAVHLDRASLCVNCNYVSNASGDRCPVCAGAGGLLSLVRVLGGGRERDRARTAVGVRD